ncbi:MAG: anhydro-N-acetylmuramic acid kinase, partial [Candidatus Electrothrix sp. AR5]|nr:anhydro-N-acetylmuramic acid kinase [Candidatus Electrothrix sp. AR5]
MSKMLTAIGLMSGTSLDGIDVAMIKTDGVKIQQLDACITVAYDDELKQRVKRAMMGESSDIPYIEADLTMLHADAVKQLLSISGETVDIIGF